MQSAMRPREKMVIRGAWRGRRTFNLLLRQGCEERQQDHDTSAGSGAIEEGNDLVLDAEHAGEADSVVEQGAHHTNYRPSKKDYRGPDVHTFLT